MPYYNVKTVNQSAVTFQVEAQDEQQAQQIVEAAMNDYSDEIYDIIDEYGDIQTFIDEIEPSNAQWSNSSEVAPGVFY